MTEKMTHRQRVLAAFNNQPTDRIPIDFGGTILSSAKPEKQEEFVQVMGLSGHPDPRFPFFDNRIQEALDTDLRQLRPKAGRNWHIGTMGSDPMRNLTIDDLDKWPWPEPTDAMVEGLREDAKFLHEETDYAVCAGQIGQGIFEIGCYLRGYDQILIDMMTEPEFVHAFNSKALEVNLALGDLYFPEIGEYADIVLIGDDLAIQTGPYMSLELFREFVKPYFKAYIDGIRKHCPNALIAHHCCGAASAFFEDLIEIGVQITNPVQTHAAGMSPAELKEWKPRIAFHGGGDLQHVLPYGTQTEVLELANDLAQNLGKGGGYVAAPCHTLPEDVKPENLILFLETLRDFNLQA